MARLSRAGAGEATTCLRVGSTGNRCLNFSDPLGLCTPKPECYFQAAANWGARKGGLVGGVVLNVAAAENGLSEALQINKLGAAIESGDKKATKQALGAVIMTFAAPEGRI